MHSGDDGRMDKRKLNEYKKNLNNPSYGSKLLDDSHGSDPLLKWVFEVSGPEGSYYEKGVWIVDVTLDGYPFKAPKLSFRDKIYHPAIDYDKGEICQNVYEASWAPTQNMGDVIKALHSVLLAPETETPLNADANILFIEDNKAFVKKVNDEISKMMKKK